MYPSSIKNKSIGCLFVQLKTNSLNYVEPKLAEKIFLNSFEFGSISKVELNIGPVINAKETQTI